MSSTISRDLGHGVRVMPGDGGGLVIQSAGFDLDWRPRMGGRPGAAVMWEESCYEVVEREPWRQGARWTLSPWGGEDVMRVVLPLDEGSIAAAAEKARRNERSSALRPWLWMLSPILGFATASWQRRWRDDWGYPASVATWLSAILEMLFGAACMVEFIAAMGAGASIFPWIPRPILFFGIYMFVEGIARLAQVFSDSEPVGTFLGLAVSIFSRREVPAAQPSQIPTITSFDEVEGVIEFLSPIQRRDWESPGLLPYRGGFFALERTERLGEAWVYSFQRIEMVGEHRGPRLRVMPPRTELRQTTFQDSPGAAKLILLTIACTLAPGRFQERWAWELGVKSKWFTIMGASAELLGGISNLSSTEGGPPLTVLLNLFFIGEALVRLGSLVLRGQTCGSILGLPLVPILERHLPEPGLPPEE